MLLNVVCFLSLGVYGCIVSLCSGCCYAVLTIIIADKLMYIDKLITSYDIYILYWCLLYFICIIITKKY